MTRMCMPCMVMWPRACHAIVVVIVVVVVGGGVVVACCVARVGRYAIVVVVGVVLAVGIIRSHSVWCCPVVFRHVRLLLCAMLWGVQYGSGLYWFVSRCSNMY